jgi:hypothetical protein
MRVALLPIVLAASLVLVACATVEKVGTSSYAPLSSTTDVALFTAESQVEAPFEVVANISYTDPGKFQILSLKDAFEPLKARRERSERTASSSIARKPSSPASSLEGSRSKRARSACR